MDRALARLTRLLRDGLVARFPTGESCAEVGRRYGRTEVALLMICVFGFGIAWRDHSSGRH